MVAVEPTMAARLLTAAAQACLASGLVDRLAFPVGKLRVGPLLSASSDSSSLGFLESYGHTTLNLRLLSADGCIAGGAGMQNSLWSETLAGCIGP